MSPLGQALIRTGRVVAWVVAASAMALALLSGCGSDRVPASSRGSNGPQAANRTGTMTTQPAPFGGVLGPRTFSILPPTTPEAKPSPPSPPPDQPPRVEPAPLPAPTEARPTPPAEVPPVLRKPTGPRTSKAALLVPLTGRAPAIGRDFLDAAQLALFDNADEMFELIIKDDGGTPEGAAKAAREAIAEGAEIILGPLFRDSVQAVTPIARERRIGVVAFSNDRGVAGNGVFILGFTPEEQVERVAKFTAAGGLKGFAAVVPDNAFGLAVMQTLERAASRLGGSLTRRQTLVPDAADPVAEMRRALSRLMEGSASVRPFQTIFIPEGGARLRAAVTQMAALGGGGETPVRLLGTREWLEPDSCRESGLIGSWFASPPLDLANAFLDRFAKIYGRRPPRLAGLAYDAVALAAVLAHEPGGPDFSIETIASPNGFAGTSGIFRFGPDGVPERGLAIVEIRAEGCVIVSPSPDSFDPTVN
ncbi:MAG: penicillin-binding protein activator [Alphaproteobacteria bacterium]|nr:penicillin-binding protein activator [Alphaproteobacteria bacterium]